MSAAKDDCPHCGRPVGLTWWELLPSRDNNRVLTCRSCQRHFDLSNGSKMASIMGGMMGMALAVLFPFGWIVRAGRGSKLYVVLAIVSVALGIGLGAAGMARVTMRLEPKP